MPSGVYSGSLGVSDLPKSSCVLHPDFSLAICTYCTSLCIHFHTPSFISLMGNRPLHDVFCSAQHVENSLWNVSRIMFAYLAALQLVSFGLFCNKNIKT